jgi:uncharacterized protein YcbK (DUF882 family)
MSNTAPITLQALFRYFKDLPHQSAAIRELEEDLAKNSYSTVMRRDRPWFQTWSQAGKQEPRKVEIQQEPAKLTPKSSFDSRLTPNIRLGEFALDREERRFHHQFQVDTAAELAAFLQRVRRAFGNRPIVITSGYRPAAINRLIGGASGSEHLYAKPNVGAVDFYVAGADIKAVERWCDREWPYSLGYGSSKGFVHLGIRESRPEVRWDY